MNPYEKGKREARRLRGEWELGSGPLKNIFQLMEEHDIDVVRWPMESDLSGCLAHIDEIDRHVVFINNRNKTLGHQVFTAAHELYHWRDNPKTSVPWESFDGTDSRKPDVEKSADAFAGAFLVPKPGLSAVMEELNINKNDFKTDHPEHIIQLQMRFDVSFEMMLYRLREYGFIGKRRLEQLKDAVSPERTALQMGFSLEDIYGDEEPHYPRLFKTKAVEALKKGKISQKKFRSLLNLDLEEFQRLVEELGIEENLAPENVGEVM